MKFILKNKDIASSVNRGVELTNDNKFEKENHGLY